MSQAYQGYFQEDVRFISDNIEEEIAKRREMVKSLKGCLAGYKIGLTQIKEKRIAKRGLLNCDTR